MLEKIEGVWEFIGSNMRDVNGIELPDPLSKATGTIIYTETSHMAVQLYIPKDDSINESHKFEDDYMGYYGTYVFDYHHQIVTHNIINSSRRELFEKSVQRSLKFYPDKNCISLTNTEPETVAMELPIYRELFWRALKA